MGQFPKSEKLLDQVAQRLHLVCVGRWVYRGTLLLAGGYGVVLLVSRLTGLIPDWFSIPTIFVFPLISAVLVLLAVRRPSQADAARKVDQHEGTKDLYLTLSMLHDASGEYQILVGRDAEHRAPGIKPVAVVPWPWEAPALKLAGVMGLLTAGVLFAPSLDPFGKVAAARQVEQRQQELAESREETNVRRTQLVEQKVDGEHSEDVDQALEDLKSAFRKMVPEARRENASLLSTNQKVLNEKWKLSAEQLKALLTQLPLEQRFGGRGDLKMKTLLNDLKQGSSQALENELREVLEDLQDLARMEDPLQRTEAMQRLKKKLDDLREFAREEANSRPLAEALERAMQQLETARMGDSRETTSEAMEALKESLKLAELEAQKLAQSARDMKELEQALQALSMARQVNQEGLLDGQMCEACQSMADYMELYAELMGSREQSLGTGGEGIGEGGEVPEDDSIRSDFKDETAKGAIQKGKLLLAIKTKGVTENDSEELNLEYMQVLGEVKQSVSEAIEQEQVPPGYHAGIKKYFDSLEEKVADEEP